MKTARPASRHSHFYCCSNAVNSGQTRTSGRKAQLQRWKFDLLYGFLISAQRIHAGLPQAAIIRFEGALRGALKDSNGLRPFAYEVGIAAHLMRKKWDVEFADLCGTARFDFLARQDSIEIEVEC
jgi:hypothetical protein